MILAFGNKARHGKDTACNAVIEHFTKSREIAIDCFEASGDELLGYPEIKRVNFADALRIEVNEAIVKAKGIENLLERGFIDYPTEEEAQSGLDFVRRVIPDWVTPELNPSINDPLLLAGKHPKLLQWWGTEYRRYQDPDYWVKKWRQQVVGFHGVVVVGDLRFWNEATAITQAGGHVVHVQRFNKDGSLYFATDRDPGHVSETQIDGLNWDFRIAAKSGEDALLGEQAITIAEYVFGLEGK
jgi:hypothetical protein